MKIKKKKKKRFGLRVHTTPSPVSTQPQQQQAAPVLSPAILQLLQTGQITPDQLKVLMAQAAPPQAVAAAPVPQPPQDKPLEQSTSLPAQPTQSVSWPTTGLPSPSQQLEQLSELRTETSAVTTNDELKKLIEEEKRKLFTIVVMPSGEFDPLVVKNATLDDIQKEFIAYVNSLPREFPWQDTLCILTETSAIWPVSQYPLVFAKSPRTGELYALTKFKMEPEFSDDGYLGASSLSANDDDDEDETEGDDYAQDNELASNSALEDLIASADDNGSMEGIEFPDDMYSNEPDA